MGGKHQARLQGFGHDLGGAGAGQAVHVAFVEGAHHHRQFGAGVVDVVEDFSAATASATATMTTLARMRPAARLSCRSASPKTTFSLAPAASRTRSGSRSRARN